MSRCWGDCEKSRARGRFPSLHTGLTIVRKGLGSMLDLCTCETLANKGKEVVVTSLQASRSSMLAHHIVLSPYLRNPKNTLGSTSAYKRRDAFFESTLDLLLVRKNLSQNSSSHSSRHKALLKLVSRDERTEIQRRLISLGTHDEPLVVYDLQSIVMDCKLSVQPARWRSYRITICV